MSDAGVTKVTEWGVRYAIPSGSHITWEDDEATARTNAAAKPAPNQKITLVTRVVVYGAWKPVRGSRPAPPSHPGDEQGPDGKADSIEQHGGTPG
jgi:hypothetical protein